MYEVIYLMGQIENTHMSNKLWYIYMMEHNPKSVNLQNRSKIGILRTAGADLQ